MQKIYFIILLFPIIFIACKQKHYQEEDPWPQIKKAFVEVNKQLVKEDRERILSYINRKGWNMTETKTGFWYEIYEQGKGTQAKPGSIVTIKYKIELLDGTLCYTSDSLGLKTFKVNFGDVISGLHQGIQLMHEGDKARFIFPPFLAYGLVGDGDKIPPHAIIVYFVDLIKVQKDTLK